MGIKISHLFFVIFYLFTSVLLYGQELDSLSLMARADSLYKVGKKFQRSFKGNEAIPLLEKALSIYERLNKTNKIGNSLNRIALVYGQIFSEWPEAEHYWLETLKVRKSIRDEKGVAWVNRYLGIASEKMGKYGHLLFNDCS